MMIEPKPKVAHFEDFSERYPYSGETIPFPVLFVIIIIIPCAILGILALTFPRKFELAMAFLSLAQTLALTLLITEILKVTVARPRPNYFSYCKYNPDSKACTGPKSHTKDAAVSFPSGHASNSFASFTWLTLFITKFFPKGEELWWVLIKISPIFGAIFVAATRITDYMHHVSDVISGCVLGIGIAVLMFSTQSKRIILSNKRPFDSLSQL